MGVTGLPQEGATLLQEAGLWRYAATLAANMLSGDERAASLERWATHLHQVCVWGGDVCVWGCVCACACVCGGGWWDFILGWRPSPGRVSAICEPLAHCSQPCYPV